MPFFSPPFFHQSRRAINHKLKGGSYEPENNENEKHSLSPQSRLPSLGQVPIRVWETNLNWMRA